MDTRDELSKLEILLRNVSGSARHWWLGGALVGCLGALSFYSGLREALAAPPDKGGSSASLVWGICLLAIAIAGTVDGYLWRKVARYLELRGPVAGEAQRHGRERR